MILGVRVTILNVYAVICGVDAVFSGTRLDSISFCRDALFGDAAKFCERNFHRASVVGFHIFWRRVLEGGIAVTLNFCHKSHVELGKSKDGLEKCLCRWGQ